MFIVPAMNEPLLFCLALLIGTCVTAAMLLILKREPTKEEELIADQGLEEEDEVDLSGIKIS